jgi:surface-anchored protein
MKYLRVFAVFASLLPFSAHAYTVITDEHVDIQVVFVSGSLSGRIHADNEGNVPRDQGLLFDGPVGTTSVNRPAGATWDFLGVAAGQPVYLWPQNNVPGRMYLGFGSDGGSIPPGTFASYLESDPRVNATARWTKITLTGMRYEPAPGESGPAQFSLWQAGQFGSVTTWMSTAEGGITSTDATWLDEGGHSHFNWGFTKRGYYQLDFVFSGYLNGSNEYIESGVQTFHFGVEYQPLVIPEPSAAYLLGGAGCLFLLRRRRPRAVRRV